MIRGFVVTFAVVAMISACIFAPSASSALDPAQEGFFTVTPVQVTVFNSLTNLRSAPIAFTR